MEARKLGFAIVVRRYDNGSNRREAFATMRCKRSGTYIPQLKISNVTPDRENISVHLNCVDIVR